MLLLKNLLFIQNETGIFLSAIRITENMKQEIKSVSHAGFLEDLKYT